MGQNDIALENFIDEFSGNRTSNDPVSFVKVSLSTPVGVAGASFKLIRRPVKGPGGVSTISRIGREVQSREILRNRSVSIMFGCITVIINVGSRGRNIPIIEPADFSGNHWNRAEVASTPLVNISIDKSIASINDSSLASVSLTVTSISVVITQSPVEYTL